MSLVPQKPWSVGIFSSHRPHLVKFVEEEIAPHLDNPECRRIMINAPVKSGKRELAEYMAMRNYSSDQRCEQMFITSWHRKADDDQRYELSQHCLQVFSIINKKEKDKCIEFIRRKLADGKNLAIHYDECDHGSGARQMMSNVWQIIRDVDRIKTIMYTATHEEILFSDEIDDDDYEEMLEEHTTSGVLVKYIPPHGYCGAETFLDAGLVYNASRIFEINQDGTVSLSRQGKEIVNDLSISRQNLRFQNRNVLIVRMSSSEKNVGRCAKKEDKKDIYLFLKNVHLISELNDYIIMVDKNEIDVQSIKTNPRVLAENIKWSNQFWWDGLTTNKPVVIIIDQTSSRSTEWACHDRVFAYHDYRLSIAYGPIAQAQLRVNHYFQRYEGFQQIRVYGHKPTFELACGRKSYNDYMNPDYIKQKVRNKDAYKIIQRTIRTVHPDFPNEYSESEAINIIASIGCQESPRLSTRVSGKIKRIVKVDGNFIACTKESFDNAVRPIITTQFANPNFCNPFERAEQHCINGIYKGYLRGWKILDYDNHVKNESWGFSLRNLNLPRQSRPLRITVCYKDGLLGIGYRFADRIEFINKLTTCNSQYKSAT